MANRHRAPVEIERKFLVEGNRWRAGASATSIRQGYLARSEDVVVRVRIADAVASLTIKARPRGFTTPEFEYPIPLDHAEFLLERCEDAIIEKTAELELHNIEFWGNHFRPNPDAKYVKEVAGKLAKRDILVNAFGVHGFREDHEKNEKVFQFA